MVRYFATVVFSGLALLSLALMLHGTIDGRRLKDELFKARFPKLEIAWTPEDQARIKAEDTRRLERHGVLVREAQFAELRARFGMVGCFVGVIAAFLALPGFVRLGKLKDSTAKTPRTLFVSYNHKNLDLAKALQEEIRGAGVDAELIDAILDVQSDEQLKSILSTRILNHPAVVVLLTPESLKSDWVSFERSLADTSLVSLIYACNRVSRFKALCTTNFSPSNKSFRAVKMLKAQRRYVTYPSDGAGKLILGHVEMAINLADGISPVRQFLGSFTSIDLIFFTWLFNAIDTRVIQNRESRTWWFARKVCMALQVFIVLAPVLLFLDFLPQIIDFFAGAQ